MIKRVLIPAALVFSVSLLSACDSAEERAQAHFDSAMELLEAGDVDRAMVEFRNVFELDAFHREARLAVARIQEERGNLRQAYGQYLRLVEQYPDDFESRKALAQMAVVAGDWDEVERHVAVARDQQPDNFEVQALVVALDYRTALLDRDYEAAAETARSAGLLVNSDPDLTIARRVILNELIRTEDWAEALEALDEMLARLPEERGLHSMRLGVLEQLGREDEVEAQLQRMVELFPDDPSIHGTLVAWYLARERLDAAEAYLRDRLDPETADDQDYVEYIAFLTRFRGTDTARAEVERILAEAPTDNRDLFRSILAGIDFDTGARDEAIAEMESLLETAEPSEQTRRIKIALANMLIRTGNAVGARALVEEVLAEDPAQVAALKMRAGWRIEDDQTGEAIVDLRHALDQAPQDAEAMTLLARAHEREGNRELVTEMLARAAEASNSAPAETLRYAGHLLAREEFLRAEEALVAALRLHADNPQLLNALGNVYIRMEDWPRTEHVISTLEGIGTDTAGAMANELTARKLAGQNREQELGEFLTQLAEQDDNLSSMAAYIRVRLAQGDVAGALDYIEEQRAEHPDNPALRFIEAAVLAIDGKTEAAETIYRALLEDFPQNRNVWVALFNLHRVTGDAEAAQAALEEGLAAMPGDPGLQWVKAGELELQGDFEDAIAIYEELYAQNSNAPVIANNLASMLSTYRDDPESLERAYTIARRLRGSDQPAFQDTYGWIAFRMGNFEEAVEHLEPAAEGLPQDPMVQFHLARAYAATNRTDEAMELFEKTRGLVEETGRRTEILEQIDAEIAKLNAPAAEN